MSSSHVWMWELNHKESWLPKNWCFWTVVLEKTLESQLHYQELKSVHPKENQSWIFIGRTDAEAETSILVWPPDAKNWLIWKDPDAGKDWRQEEKGTTENEMVGWHHWLDGHVPGMLQSMGSQTVIRDWATELNKTIPLLHNLSASAQLMEALLCNWDLASLWDNSPEQMALIINTRELSPSISAHSSGLGCDGCIYEWIRESRYFISESVGLCCIQGTISQRTDEKFKTWNSFHWEDIYSGMKKVCFFFFNLILFLNFTILYWFCQTSKWIRHRYTCVPHPEPSSLLPPHTIPLGPPSAPAPSIQYRASNLDWWLVPYMILYIYTLIVLFKTISAQQWNRANS